MKQNYAITTSMLMLALILIGAQTHALFMSGGSNEAAPTPVLKASIIETINNLEDLHQQHEEPPAPFDRGAPSIIIH